MFATADWTQPQIGGLLRELIVKEEKHLRQHKPRIQVRHIWDPETLMERESFWAETRPRRSGERFRQLSGSQMIDALNANKAHELSRSSAVIGSNPECSRPTRSSYARQKPYPDQAVHSWNGPGRIPTEMRSRELRELPRPWQKDKSLPPLASIVSRPRTSAFCIRPGELPIE